MWLHVRVAPPQGYWQNSTLRSFDHIWMIFLTISYLHENTWTGEILNLPDCNKKCTVICKNWIVWFSLNLQFRVIKTNATIPYHKFKFNNCEKKEVNLRSLYFTYFPNYVCNLQYDTNKKLYKSAISHPIGWNKTSDLFRVVSTTF